MNTNTILFILLLILLGALIFCSCSSKKEGYTNMFYNGDLNNSILSRPTFSSNLDPTNPNMRFDPHVYGGFIKGQSPPNEMLATSNMTNTDAGLDSTATINAYSMSQYDALSHPQSSRENFALSMPSGVRDQTTSGVSNGTYTAGINDAAQFTKYSDYSTYAAGSGLGAKNTSDQTIAKLSLSGSPSASRVAGGGDYGVIDTDFSSLAGDNTEQSKLQATKKWKATLSNKIPNTLDYTTPKELLPTPDMRQTVMRDPSDPSNFMYDRTIFAPLKKRNHNEADRFRGDLDISPVKTGWFDVASQPDVDLVKGYFGYFNDIQQYSDLQDVAYTHSKDDNGADTLQATDKLNTLLTKLNTQMVKPNLAYGRPQALNFGPLQSQYTTSNPWHDSVNNAGKANYQL